MTMGRSEKANHQRYLGDARRDGFTPLGFTEYPFHHPRLIAAAQADRGHRYMTAREYARHAMGRGVNQMIDRRELAIVKLRARRTR